MGNMFLFLTDIPGESLDDRHRNEIEIHEWTWGVDNKASFKLQPDVAAAQTTFDHITVTKMFDRASVTLMNYCATGGKIGQGIITCRKNDGEQHSEFLTITLTDVKVNSVKWTGKGEEIRGIPETVDLSFFKFEIIYETQNNDGNLLGGVEFDFDVPNQK